jgi:hypothetical protein
MCHFAANVHGYENNYMHTYMLYMCVCVQILIIMQILTHTVNGQSLVIH